MSIVSPRGPNADPRVARTQARVLAAAWDVLAEVGFDRVTIELISERSGVARSTMYRHWTTREEILRDAFSARAGHHVDGDQPTPDAYTALTTYAVSFAAGLADDWGRAAVTMATRALDEPDQRRAVRTFADGSWDDLSAIVSRAVDEGVLAADTDVNGATSRLNDALIAPLFYRYHVLGEPAGAQQAHELAERAWSALMTATG